jgi:uncharacterized SAM-binding protein YcdF (DUF218 family)
MTYTQPLLPLLFLIAGIAIFRYWRKKEAPKPTLLALAVLGLFLVSWPPVGWLSLRALEAPYPPGQLPASDGEAIVVLASTVYPASPPVPTPRLASDTFERVLYAAWLYKNWRPLPILASGGTNSSETPPYSLLMRDQLRLEGVPDSAIWTEEGSRSTHENAVFSANILQKKGIHKIVLVTEAYHMLRAEKSFRKQGLIVVPAACGYRAYGNTLQGRELLPNWEPIAWNEDFLHETLGLFWYWIHGWI